MARKVTVVLSGPPADGLLSAREHFDEYVRPILMAAGMDWDAVEGRKEGDVRAQIAERIRELRLRSGEEGGESIEADGEKLVREMRASNGIHDEDAVTGEIVIGRHTWKEYIRGLHEGWLGPLAEPKELVDEESKPVFDEPTKTEEPPIAHVKEQSVESIEDILSDSSESSSSAKDLDAEKAKQEEEAKRKAEDDEEEEAKKKKRPQPLPFISTSDYASANLATACPNKLGPSVAVPLPHILGFLNTPIRMWRFLNQRKIADDVGKSVAAAIIASYAGYSRIEKSFDVDSSSPAAGLKAGLVWEQETLLENEEPEWHKSIRKRTEEEKAKESVWLDPVVMDERIAERMVKFVLPVQSDSSSGSQT
jgi:mitochondrial import inner membrane translocase subunit TIM54